MSTDTRVAADLPLRIIGYAWGDSYVDELLNFAIPALLSPGNLPAVASEVKSELVLLSEQRLFGKILSHPVIAKVQELCAVRLVGLDDLITTSEKYGMALTYVLHRAFADLGTAMTDHWLMFLNADFVIADGSLRNLLGHLRAGEHVVAAPSYCTVREELKPELRRQMSSHATSLAIAPRDLARLILRHRHNTVRGKTVNQDRYHVLQADQFYWQVDEDTLIGHQMPVAIVGMRPKRYLAEPNSYWDYGLIWELCPNTDVKVLGDSDEFLMLELRDRNVARDQIVPGRPNPRDLAERMITWVTPYQASFALQPLTLHAGEVPPGTEFARKRLGQFVGRVLSYAPNFPSHTGHPQWDYHWPDFTRSRHSYLSSKLGALTEAEPPPAGSAKLDRLWWTLDGAEKSLRRKIKLRGSAPKLVDDFAACDQTLADEIGVSTGPKRSVADLYADARSWQNANRHSATPGKSSTLDEPEGKKQQPHASGSVPQQAIADADDRLVKMRREYEGLMRPRVKTAGIPIVRWQEGHESPLALAERMSRRIARSAYYRVFGRWPHVTMLDPRWAAAQPLLRALDTAKAKGARDALVVSGPTGLLNISGFDGKIARMTYDGFMSGLLHKALVQREQFDLCILDLRQEDIPRFAEIAHRTRPYVRPGATIVGFAMLPTQQLSALLTGNRNGKVVTSLSLVPISEMPVYYGAVTGASPARFGAGAHPNQWRRWLRIALQAPRFWWANHAAAAVKDDATSTIAYAAGVTIELQVPTGAATEFSSPNDRFD